MSRYDFFTEMDPDLEEAGTVENKSFICRNTKSFEKKYNNVATESLVLKVTDSWLACHEFEPSTTKDQLCKKAMQVKSHENSNILSFVWFGSKEREVPAQK
ncbi:hypothetical protein TNCV_480451 [Trichonephila clavipes]|nr:hypothetical protein TNCV_480451 [Trichonephila clavipes]